MCSAARVSEEHSSAGPADPCRDARPAAALPPRAMHWELTEQKLKCTHGGEVSQLGADALGEGAEERLAAERGHADVGGREPAQAVGRGRGTAVCELCVNKQRRLRCDTEGARGQKATSGPTEPQTGRTTGPPTREQSLTSPGSRP